MASLKAHLPKAQVNQPQQAPQELPRSRKKHTHENELDQIRSCAFVWQAVSSVVKIIPLYQGCFHCSAQTSSAESISVYCKESVSQQLLRIQLHFSLILLFLHLSETLVSCYFYRILNPTLTGFRKQDSPDKPLAEQALLLQAAFQFVCAVAELMRVCRHIKNKCIIESENPRLVCVGKGT